MLTARTDRPAKGYTGAETLDVLAALSDAGADAFFINGFTLRSAAAREGGAEEAADDRLERPRRQWHARGVDMAFYHIDDIGIGAMHIALKDMKAKGGPFDEAAKWRPPRDVTG